MSRRRYPPSRPQPHLARYAQAQSWGQAKELLRELLAIPDEEGALLREHELLNREVQVGGCPDERRVAWAALADHLQQEAACAATAAGIAQDQAEELEGYPWTLSMIQAALDELASTEGPWDLERSDQFGSLGEIYLVWTVPDPVRPLRRNVRKALAWEQHSSRLDRWAVVEGWLPEIGHEPAMGVEDARAAEPATPPGGVVVADAETGEVQAAISPEVQELLEAIADASARLDQEFEHERPDRDELLQERDRLQAMLSQAGFEVDALHRVSSAVTSVVMHAIRARTLRQNEQQATAGSPAVDSPPGGEAPTSSHPGPAPEHEQAAHGAPVPDEGVRRLPGDRRRGGPLHAPLDARPARAEVPPCLAFEEAQEEVGNYAVEIQERGARAAAVVAVVNAKTPEDLDVIRRRITLTLEREARARAEVEAHRAKAQAEHEARKAEEADQEPQGNALERARERLRPAAQAKKGELATFRGEVRELMLQVYPKGSPPRAVVDEVRSGDANTLKRLAEGFTKQLAERVEKSARTQEAQA